MMKIINTMRSAGRKRQRESKAVPVKTPFVVQVTTPDPDKPAVLCRIVYARTREEAKARGQRVIYEQTGYTEEDFPFAEWLDAHRPGVEYAGSSYGGEMLFEAIQDALADIKVRPLDEWMGELRSHWVCLCNCEDVGEYV